MLNYFKILLIGFGLMILLGGGIVAVGYFWAKATGRLAQHPSQTQSKKEDASYEAFAGGFDDEPASTSFSSEIVSEKNDDTDGSDDEGFSFEFDSDSDGEVDTIDFE